MIAHVHQALEQVRTMHRHLIDKQRFKGYSGRARAISGTLTLATAVALARHPPLTPSGTVAVWLGLAAVCIAVNCGATLVWFFTDPQVSRDRKRLRPTLEIFPALLVGAVLTLCLWRDGAYAYLVPVWMLIFGLANLASRHVLPKGIGLVGGFYIASGAVLLLLAPGVPLANPWPMGIVFFAGEWMGALVLHLDRA